MNDPAMVIAREVLDRWTTGDWNASRDFVAVAAVRAAHEPLRKLHHSYDAYIWAITSCERNGHETTNDTENGEDICYTCTEQDGGPQKRCEHCRDEDGERMPWPCETAKLCYSDYELETGILLS